MTDSDHITIVVCAVRYAMGRRTYMTKLVIDYVQRHWDEFGDKDKRMIKSEVSSFIKKMGKKLSVSLGVVSINEWIDLLEWIAKR